MTEKEKFLNGMPFMQEGILGITFKFVKELEGHDDFYVIASQDKRSLQVTICDRDIELGRLIFIDGLKAND